MKKVIITLIILVSSLNTFADQLEALTKEQAEKSLSVLRSQKELLLWCSCCEGNNPKTLVKVTNVYYESAKIENYFFVFIEGTDQNGNKIKQSVDLAYVFYKNNSGNAECVGRYLGFKCDPCTGPFGW